MLRAMILIFNVQHVSWSVVNHYRSIFVVTSIDSH